MGIWAIVIGVVLIVLAGLELYSVVRTFNNTRKNGTKNTSPFIMYGLWTGVIVAFFLAFVGIATIARFY